MRTTVLIVALTLFLGIQMCGRAKLDTSAASKLNSRSSTETTKPDFDKQIKPIFQARCQPCHFQGGKVYDHLPFDKPETITRLGEKLFTRIKDKEEQRLIREFLSQP